jgi:predicted nucleotidyltransferase
LLCIVKKNESTSLADNRDRALEILEAVNNWAKSQEDIRGVALVGSHARNAAGPNSDIDLVLLAENPNGFRDAAWLATIEWSRVGVRPTKWSDEEYGVLWCRRIWFEPQGEIEFAFAPLSWAALSPVDKGTRRVVADGCRILYDPDGLLKRMTLAVACL